MMHRPSGLKVAFLESPHKTITLTQCIAAPLYLSCVLYECGFSLCSFLQIVSATQTHICPKVDRRELEFPSSSS